MAQIILSPLTEIPKDLKSLLDKYHQSPIIQEIWIHGIDSKTLYGYYFNQYNKVFKLNKEHRRNELL